MILRRGSFFVVLALIGILALQACGAAGWKIGDRVIANWTGDDYWYPGTIAKIEGGQYYVVYMDGDEEWVSANRLAKEEIKAGDKVECNWLGQGYYYPGTIGSRNGDEITMNYDDGDNESTTIASVRILKQ